MYTHYCEPSVHIYIHTYIHIYIYATYIHTYYYCYYYYNACNTDFHLFIVLGGEIIIIIITIIITSTSDLQSSTAIANQLPDQLVPTHISTIGRSFRFIIAFTVPSMQLV